jgi:hypothetical protein
VAQFLGDDRLPTWLQLAVHHLQGLLSSTTDEKQLSSYVAATERLNMDVLDGLLQRLPLSTTLTTLSATSHVRAIQARLHQDEHGQHVHIEMNTNFNEEHARALGDAVACLPIELQPVTVTLRHGEQRIIFGQDWNSDTWSSQASEGLSGFPDVQPALVHMAGGESQLTDQKATLLLTILQ